MSTAHRVEEAQHSSFDAGRHVLERGLLPSGTNVRVTQLTGGVSGEVSLVEGPDAAIVVKRALAQLQVQALWTAKPERALTEAKAIQVCHALTPSHTPALLDVDADQLVFAMTAAPASWQPWKSVLLALADQPFDLGTSERVCGVAEQLGHILGLWHGRTWHDAGLAAEFDDYETFAELRLAPFHEYTAAHNEQHRAVLMDCAAELREGRDCLVHGDYSPKNVLVGGGGVWVLDFEVAHFGAAVFDMAFLQSHLMLKAIHLPAWSQTLASAGTAAMRAYLLALAGRPAPENVAVHAACLMLARLDGMSPVSYLSASDQREVRTVTDATLGDGGEPLEQLWQRITAASWQ
jgi:tRNA A-37 threonylcarbamoyl transferase component Bud32